MHATWDYLTRHWDQLLTPLIVFGVVLTLGLAFRSLVLRALARHSRQTGSRVSALLRGTASKPSVIWILLLALLIANEFLPIRALAQKRIDYYVVALWTLSVTFAAAQFARQLVRLWGPDLAGSIPVTSLTENVARIVIFSVGGLVLLNQLGLSITPILTALGVGGLAVALALQPTLSNLFSGIWMSVSGQIRPGDYVRLSSNEEGFVQDITWRSTTIRALANNLIIIPNAKLADVVITNFHLPEKRMSLLIPIGVSYSTDPDHLERVLLEVARGAVGEIPGLLAEPEPIVRFIPGFGDFSLNFTLIVQVAEFTDQFLVQSELRRRILKRFRQEKIEIPFPVRTIRMEPPALPGGSEIR
jgi:small-conductance mechanosensitive channel